MTRPICPHCGFDLERDEPVDRAGIAIDPFGICQFHGQPLRLTRSERQILFAIVKADGAILSRAVLAERVGYEGDHNVVDVFLTRIRNKMKPIAPPPLETVWGVGVRLAA